MGCTKTYNTPEVKIELAQCLVKEGVTMYGAEWCGYCRKEKEEFGLAWEIMQKNYIECSDEKNINRCMQIAIDNRISFPTWKFKNGKMVIGYKTLQELAELSGCN